ncbi:MAG: Uma2 family endonuclease [Pseudonocardiaceae bacterium]
MRAVLLEVPQVMLDERRRLGLDERDEMWNGVLHMVPPLREPQKEVSGELFLVLGPLAQQHGLRGCYATALFRTSDDYRVPNQLYCRPEHRSERLAKGAELVVEIRTGDDETYEKIDFYARLGVHEVLILHPEARRVELLRAVGGRLLPVSGDVEGAVRSDVVGALFATVDGRLRVTWQDGKSEL